MTPSVDPNTPNAPRDHGALATPPWTTSGAGSELKGLGLFLGPADSRVFSGLKEYGGRWLQTSERIDRAALLQQGVSWIVSFGYEHIVRPAVLEAVRGRAVNLHISALPWNRGSDPNLWSVLEDTPRGVSVHWMDAGIDTGDLIAQAPAPPLRLEDTLRSTYEELQMLVADLFLRTWPAIVCGDAPRTAQPRGGSVHRAKDKLPYLHLLTEGWDTKVLPLLGKAREAESARP